MAPFSTKKYIKSSEYRVHWNISIPINKFLYKKISVVNEANIEESSINQKSSSLILVMLCTGTTFVKKNSCLVARIVLFDAAGLYLLIFCILEPFSSKEITLVHSHAIWHWRYYSTLQLSLIWTNASKFPSC